MSKSDKINFLESTTINAFHSLGLKSRKNNFMEKIIEYIQYIAIIIYIYYFMLR